MESIDEKSMKFFGRTGQYGYYDGNDARLLEESTGIMCPMEYTHGIYDPRTTHHLTPEQLMALATSQLTKPSRTNSNTHDHQNKHHLTPEQLMILATEQLTKRSRTNLDVDKRSKYLRFNEKDSYMPDSKVTCTTRIREPSKDQQCAMHGMKFMK